MKKDLDILKGYERGALYIIGNEFDLFHKLETRYSNFHNWLIQYRHDVFVLAMEMMFPSLKEGKLLPWKDFENALGVFDPEMIQGEFFQGRDGCWFNEIV